VPATPEKTLDAKLARIHADPHGAGDFILADAKDADMAMGLKAPGLDPVTGAPRSLAEYRDHMREIVRQGLVDIMLMSASSNDLLTNRERLFDDSPVTPAVRANDATDIHLVAGGTYADAPSRPFRTPTIEQIMTGRAAPGGAEGQRGADLGLYSITLNNDVASDLPVLDAYREFRLDAERKGLRHFLEIFEPNAAGDRRPAELGRFLNDVVARTLAGVPQAGRPVFLKMPYAGPEAMEALVAYDPHLVVGILGGSAGTTYDAFFLLEDARRHGARAALFGRKINNSEHQPTFVRYLRALADGDIDATEACRAYHADLERLGIRPRRSLEDDLAFTAAGFA